MKKLLLLLIMLTLYTCENNKMEKILPNHMSFNKFDENRFVNISSALPVKYFSPPLVIDIIQDHYLIVTNKDLDEFVQIYDIDSKEMVASFGKKGKGPGEFLKIRNIIILNDNDDVFGLFDVNQYRISYYSVSNILNENLQPITIKKVSIESGLPYGICPIDSSRFLSWGMHIDNRFAIYDSKLTVLKTCQLIPEELLTKNTPELVIPNYSYYLGGLEHNSYKQKFASVFYFSDIMQIFDSDINPILTVQGPDQYPLYGLSPKNDKHCGYQSLKTSNNFIYCVYSGEQKIPKDWIKSFGKNIHIFDWEGRPLKRIRTDYRMGNLTLSESQKRLYLVYYDEEYFRLGYIDLQEDEL